MRTMAVVMFLVFPGQTAFSAAPAEPTHADISYGPHPRNVLDIWIAKGTGPRPLLVFIHGGGWTGGDKKREPAELKPYLDQGISCAAINYRLSVDFPLPAPVHDAARSIQFLRTKARDWNIDPSRIAVTGESAGACSSMWLLFHDDLADPNASDPVLRQSTRVCAAAAISGQTSIDPKVIEPWLGPNVLKHRMINLSVGEPTIEDALQNYDQHRALYEEFSPYNHVDGHDPPLLMTYRPDMSLPSKDAGHGIHHGAYGVKLKEKSERVGHECHLLIPDFAKSDRYDSPRDFLIAKLTHAPATTAPGTTSLTNPAITFTTPDLHFAAMQRGPVQMVVVDNEAIDTPFLQGHRAGYNGVASLAHAKRLQNLFVPTVAGLNFEHIHDGTRKVDKERFEPRRSPMSLRVINEHTVEVYQPPTENWKLESCGRYELLDDGTIEYTFECIPRAACFDQGFIGLFWASYIDHPEDKAIHFIGKNTQNKDPSGWLTTTSPQHGVDSTHPPEQNPALPKIDPAFSLTLVNHPSKYVYTEPWYYGVSHGMAYVQMFRDSDRIWFAQSPTGGGDTNPAWDFQWFIPEYQVNIAYGFVMRATYLPYESVEQVERATRTHREALKGR